MFLSMARTAPPAVDVRKVVDRFGGVNAIVALSDIAGFGLTPFQVRKWLERGVIPMQRWLQLKALAVGAGWVLVLEDFLIQEAVAA
jgi:hypothetical protein